MRSLLASLLLLSACGGSSAPDSIVSMCDTLEGCGVIAAADHDSCVSDLDAATPDSASKAADECATCVSTMTCGDVSTGKCQTTCAPFLATAHSTPGAVEITSTTDPNDKCTSSSTANYVDANGAGVVSLHISCGEQVGNVKLGAIKVGQPVACSIMNAPLLCSDGAAVSGNMMLVEREGRRWLSGACMCDLSKATLDVPFRIF